MWILAVAERIGVCSEQTKKWPGAAPPLSKTNCASIGKCKAMWEREFGHPDGKCAPEAASHGVCEIGGYG